MYKIMLADDEGIVIDSVKFIIEKEFGDECVIEFAKTGRSVIELAETFRPDIAIMDIQMPVMNGYEASRSIRASQHPDADDIRIIAVSADAFAQDVEKALDAGMDAHIAKPIEYDLLFRELEKTREAVKK